MRVIDNHQAAEKLGRAILCDITLYNDTKLRAANDVRTELGPEIDEGRALFRQRVAPQLHDVFEEMVTGWIAARGVVARGEASAATEKPAMDCASKPHPAAPEVDLRADIHDLRARVDWLEARLRDLAIPASQATAERRGIAVPLLALVVALLLGAMVMVWVTKR